jgi:hypothetical protein
MKSPIEQAKQINDLYAEWGQLKNPYDNRVYTVKSVIEFMLKKFENNELKV